MIMVIAKGSWEWRCLC